MAAVAPRIPPKKGARTDIALVPTLYDPQYGSFGCLGISITPFGWVRCQGFRWVSGSYTGSSAAGDEPVPERLLASSIICHRDAANAHSIPLRQAGSRVLDLLAVHLHNGPVQPQTYCTYSATISYSCALL